MIFKWMTYFILANLIVPIITAYVFFSTWGYALGDNRIGFRIENLSLSPKGAGLAALVSVAFTIIGTLPLSAIGAFLILVFANTQFRWIVLVSGAVMGSTLGLLVQKTHFKSLFSLELGILGGVAGILLAWISVKLLGMRP